MYLIFSCSLRSISRSYLLAKQAFEEIKNRGEEAELVDLRDWELPYCDGESTGNHEQVLKLEKKIRAAKGILISAPIYNFDMNALSRGLAELTAGAWEGKLVGLLCAAGGKGSYMAPMGLANSLLLHYHCFILPRIVYGTEAQFEGDSISDPELHKRVLEQVDMLLDVGTKLRGAPVNKE
ncbi:Uncharacterized protein SCG7109_AH_00210 [Chlamydiales bacterium SCGC AG-110-M15]|nr:Uncharacterized protein SCG7109_AH_00210 [Chlamydiales bacterium SCGC AG-110-M15]